MENNKKIIITGPTGAIGMALIKRCMEEGICVVAVCHKGSARIAQIPQSRYVRVVEADLSELVRLGKRELGFAETENADIFYHFAWEGTTGAARNDMPLQIGNIQYTIDAVELAARLGCNTFIGAGSQAEYGRAEGVLTAETPVFPENGYGMAKLCAGQMSRQRCEALGIRHIWVRILSVYGPYDGQGSMVMSAIRKLAGGERAGFTRGEQMWDYLYSEDAAAAMRLLGDKGIHGKTYVLGSGKVQPLKEYILQIRRAVEHQVGVAGEPGWGDIPYSDKQVMYLGADITELRRDTGFEPEVTFDEGIRNTVSSMIRMNGESADGRN
ncbi:MAG: NAD-dependent epimerase/dehydratase family protein [Roseburia sp.]|nr:NAD-dependent epimerase/dehydratase family protein [Roseburia sp.]